MVCTILYRTSCTTNWAHCPTLDKDNTMKKEHEVELAIYRADPSQGYNVNELEYGTLLASLTENHWAFHVTADDGSTELEDGPLYVRVNRTHEWELILGLMVLGSGIFATKIIEKIAERAFDWAESQAKKLSTKGQPKLVGPEGMSVAVDRTNKTSSIDGITKMLELAAEKRLRVQLIIEPKE